MNRVNNNSAKKYRIEYESLVITSKNVSIHQSYNIGNISTNYSISMIMEYLSYLVMHFLENIYLKFSAVLEEFLRFKKSESLISPSVPSYNSKKEPPEPLVSSLKEGDWSPY